MVWISAYELTRIVEIPEWADRFAFMRRLWGHPLFQVRYKRNQLEPVMKPLSAFRAGMTLAVIACGIQWYWDREDTNLFMWSMLCVAGPAAFMLAVEWLQCMSNCIVTSAKDYRYEKSYGLLDLIYVAPLTDGGLFYSVFLPCAIRSINKLEPIATYCTGALVIYIFYPLAVAFMTGKGTGELFSYSLMGIGIAVWVIGSLTLIVLVSALAVGLYSMGSMNPYIASGLAFGHMLLVSLFSCMFLLLFPISSATGANAVRGLAGAGVFQVSWLIIAVYSTGLSGLYAFSRQRRPGYYEDEKASADDLMLRG